VSTTNSSTVTPRFSTRSLPENEYGTVCGAAPGHVDSVGVSETAFLLTVYVPGARVLRQECPALALRSRPWRRLDSRVGARVPCALLTVFGGHMASETKREPDENSGLPRSGKRNERHHRALGPVLTWEAVISRSTAIEDRSLCQP
jgi:hypothetical protein